MFPKSEGAANNFAIIILPNPQSQISNARLPNPVEIEQRFQNLLAFLAYPASARQRLHEIKTFLDGLGEDLSAHEPYLLELVPQLPGLIQALNGAGCSPETLHSLLEKLHRLQAQLPMAASIQGFPAAIKELQRLVCALYAYAGDLQTGLSLLDEGVAHEALNGSSQSSPPLMPLALIRQARERMNGEDTLLAATLDEMIAHWAPVMKEGDASIVVPVVERSVANTDHRGNEGGLRGLTIRIFGTASEERDEIDADVRVVGAQRVAADITQAPIAAARRLLAETYPQLAKKFFAGKISFDAAHALHEGASSNLAMAALFYCAVLRQTDQRRQFRLAANVAMTGDLDEKGEVLPVDAKTLGVKVKAAFFSWVEYLVVPKKQLNAVETFAQELAKQYPHRHLAIIGVSHLREIFYDRRLTERECVSKVRHVARKAWRQKFTVGGLATILILILVIGKLIYGPIDKNPVAGEFAGELLLIKNKHGEIVDNILVGPATVQHSIGVGYDKELISLDYVTFFDVDGDGMNEVFWVQWEDEKTAQPGRICCKSVREDTVRWSISIRRALNFPRKPDVKSDHFNPKHIKAGDFDGDGKSEVLVNSSHDFFPSLILKLEAKTGKELGHYVHIGHLPSMKLVDLDNNGITEVLLCGVNNAFREACLLVLDPRFISGHSPLAGDYAIAGYPPGLEKAYIRIPKTIVGEAMPEDTKNNIAKTILLQPASHNFFLRITDATYFYAPSDKQAVLFGYFDFNLQVQGFGTADSYDLMAEKLFRERRISRLPDYAYFEEYKKAMMYWDGEGWQNQPVMNKHYLEVVKAK